MVKDLSSYQHGAFECKAVRKKSTLFRPFPDARRILAERSRPYLLPIGVVNYQKFNPRFAHSVLIALPVEPQEDYLGTGREARKYHTESCQENWLGYSLKKERWDVDCDLRFFSENPWESAFYEKTHAHFLKVKNFYKKHGFIQYPIDRKPIGCRGEDLMQVGGPVFMGNWVDHDKTVTWYDKRTRNESVVIFNRRGHPYHFIGRVTEYYFKGVGDTALFFYEPRSRNVRVVVDYS
jgi:hypothetical protein